MVVLAHLIRETQYVQVYRRLHFMKNMWSVPVDEYWNGVKADVASHRYRPYLETFCASAASKLSGVPSGFATY